MTTDTYTPPAPPVVRKVDMEQPWTWLAAGWRDLWRSPGISLLYGLAVTVASFAMTGALLAFDLFPLVLPMAAGFMLIGPMLAVGLYEKSRRLEANQPILARDVIFVATASPTQLAFIGALLTFFILAWIRVATLLFAVFYGADYPPLSEFVPTLLFTPRGLIFLAIGSAAGGVLAFIAFAVSAISVPMLMVRDLDAITAMLTSVQVVRQNFKVMLLWAWLIALITGFGIAFGYLGLIVTFPLVGHATWHAYRAMIEPPA